MLIIGKSVGVVYIKIIANMDPPASDGGPSSRVTSGSSLLPFGSTVPLLVLVFIASLSTLTLTIARDIPPAPQDLFPRYGLFGLGFVFL